MPSAEKFTFGQDFGKAGATVLAPSASERARAEIEARARSEGYAAGLAEGRRQAKAELDQRMTGALETVASRAAVLINDIDRIGEDVVERAVGLALEFAVAAAAAATERFPLAALESAARDVFAQVRRAPHCVVRIHEDLVEDANNALARAARECGFEGKIVVMGDPEIATGDFSLDWADGGVRRDGEALRRQLIETIERHAPAMARETNS